MMSDLLEEHKYKNYLEIQERINKNYQYIKEVEKLLTWQENDLDRLRLIELIGYLYSSYITGQYASEKLEKELIAIGNDNINFFPEKIAEKNHILIVMTASANVGGHSVLVNNWIRWDTQHKYSVVFTEQDYDEVAGFIKESVNVSQGKIYSLKGDYILKARKLLDISQNFEKILLFTHMHDIVPVLAYGNKNWVLPVLFYNHADFRFSFGFSIADVVLNLNKFDLEKSQRFRGLQQGQNILMKSPNGVQVVKTSNGVETEKEEKSKKEKKSLLAEKFGFCENEKLVVSAGADFKYEDVLDYQFDKFADTLLKKMDYKATFLIIGADKEREKWKNLYEHTNGKGRALGLLPREEMNSLIEVADLYIVSFPMISSGAVVAEKAQVPYLALFIIEREIDAYLNNAVRTIDELIEKSLDILAGNGKKYLGHILESSETKEEWRRKWEKILANVNEHSIIDIHPKRFIEMQEYVNCQLLQDNAVSNVRRYLFSHEIGDKLQQQLWHLDNKYGMNIFNGLEISKDADKYFKLYLMLIKWMHIKQSGKCIEDYLLENGWHSIAIYGMSYMGKTLFHEINQEHIEVKYGIDIRANIIHADIPVYFPNENLPMVDVIINTTTVNNKAILEKIGNKNMKMLALTEIIEELL